MTHRELRVLAPAKVNLILRVLDRRPDGYHNLWSLMHTVGLADELHVRVRLDGDEVRLTCEDPVVPTDRRNLICRAAALVLEQAAAQGVPKVGLDIALTKRVPVAAGLGGGSSDAAATIAALNRLLSLGWTTADMARVGERLGSDVPFFFHAPTAKVWGRGEQVAALLLTGARWVVLVNPGFPIETRWAYERLAAARTRPKPLPEALRRLKPGASLSWEELIPLMENDFEEALAPAYPVLGEIKRELLAAGAEAALLSGSGATVFGLFPDEASARRARAAVAAAPGRRAYAVAAGGEPPTGL